MWVLDGKVQDRNLEWWKVKDHTTGLPEEEVHKISLFRQHKMKLAWGLVYIMSLVHKAGVLHNDISPRTYCYISQIPQRTKFVSEFVTGGWRVVYKNDGRHVMGTEERKICSRRNATDFGWRPSNFIFMGLKILIQI